MSSDQDHHHSPPTPTPPPARPLPERNVIIICKPTLTYSGGTAYPDPVASATYTQAAAIPAMPSAVDPDSGAITIDQLSQSAIYSDNITITMVLDPSGILDSEGNPVSAVFAPPGTGLVLPINPDPAPGSAIPKAEAKGSIPSQYTSYCYFVAAQDYAPGSAINTLIATPPGITLNIQGDTQFTISDRMADNSGAYAFVMGIIVATDPESYVRIDPVLSSKGTSSEPP